MADVAESKDKAVNKKSSETRPDGMDVTRYKNRNSWSYHQWAWEFLRRNQKFIEACEKARAKIISKQVVARKFGLKKFKHCNESYLNKSGPPKFTIVSPFLWDDLNLSKKKARRISLNLWPGQMIVRLDLAWAIEHAGAIDKQVREAWKLIKEKVVDFKISYKTSTKPHKRQEQTFGINIRLLDLKAAGKTNLECGEIILKKKMQNKASSDDLREDIKQRLKSAKQIAKKDYIYLSVREGGPTEGTLIPIEN